MGIEHFWHTLTSNVDRNKVCWGNNNKYPCTLYPVQYGSPDYGHVSCVNLF